MSIINTNMNKEYKIKAEVLGKPWEFTEEEFKFVKQLLGEPSAVSNCCSAEILEEIVDHTARCPECKEGCEVIYIF
jgi:predicted Zn-ribbon and HTH transcriptional regulator